MKLPSVHWPWQKRRRVTATVTVVTPQETVWERAIREQGLIDANLAFSKECSESLREILNDKAVVCKQLAITSEPCNHSHGVSCLILRRRTGTIHRLAHISFYMKHVDVQVPDPNYNSSFNTHAEYLFRNKASGNMYSDSKIFAETVLTSAVEYLFNP